MGRTASSGEVRRRRKKETAAGDGGDGEEDGGKPPQQKQRSKSHASVERKAKSSRASRAAKEAAGDLKRDSVRPSVRPDALFDACAAGDLEAARKAIAAARNVAQVQLLLNFRSRLRGELPIHAAVRCGSVEAVRFVVQEGAKPAASPSKALAEGSGSGALFPDMCFSGAKLGDELSALHLAASLGRLEVLRLLLEVAAGVGHADRVGRTALHHVAAAESVLAAHARDSPSEDADSPGCARLLIDAGADIDARDSTALLRTPLLEAAWHGNEAVVAILREAGASEDIKDRNGKSASDYERQRKEESIRREREAEERAARQRAEAERRAQLETQRELREQRQRQETEARAKKLEAERVASLKHTEAHQAERMRLSRQESIDRAAALRKKTALEREERQKRLAAEREERSARVAREREDRRSGQTALEREEREKRVAAEREESLARVAQEREERLSQLAEHETAAQAHEVEDEDTER
jgi:Ankyrin repeat